MLENNVRIIKHKVGLLNLAEELGNVSRTCKTMGLSRDTFYRYKAAVEQGGVESLFDKSRRQPNLKNRVDDLTEQSALTHAVDYPAHGQLRVSNELRKGGGVSPSGVRSIWLRHGLANFKDRLKALERGVAIFAKAFMGIPAQQAAKATRPLMPAAAPAVLLHSLDTQQGVSNILLAMTRRDVGKPAFSLRKKRFVKTHALSLLGTTRLLSRSERRSQSKDLS